MELSKAERKAARILIDKGIERDFEAIMNQTDAIIAEWRKGELPAKDGYHTLYRHITASDEHIARSYDRITGSSYLFVVAGQYARGLLSDADLEILPKHVRDAIRFMQR